ncbi:MAG: hypothetical protein ABSB35_05320 [Bryobacteraceae bacterium]|jgi:hypothetical protein
MAPERLQIGATLTRAVYVCVGLAAIAVGLIGRGVNSDELSLWRRAGMIAGGLFFVYCGSMYYFPRYRKMRAELDRVLDEDSKADARDP